MDLSAFIRLASEVPAYRHAVGRLRESPVEHSITVPSAAQPYLVAALNKELGLPTLVIVPTSQEARSFHEQLLIWCGHQSTILPFPEADGPPRVTGRSLLNEQQRLKVLAALASLCDDPQNDVQSPIIIASALAVIARTLPCHKFASGRYIVTQDMTLSLTGMLAKCSAMGYRREPVVETPGTMGHHGGILDIFPPHSDLPARIEFVGNQVESIRLFDPRTQRSLRRVPSIEIIPASENVWPPSSTLIDYLPKQSLVILTNVEVLKATLDEAASTVNAPSDSENKHARCAGEGYLPGYDELRSQVDKVKHRLVLNRWAGQGGDGESMPILPPPNQVGQLKQFASQVRKLSEEGYRVLIVSQLASRVSEVLQEEDVIAAPLQSVEQLPPRCSVTLVQGLLPEGWVMEHELALFTDAEIFGFVKRPAPIRRRPASLKHTILDLSPGDYAVHIDHGIARFRGMKKVRTGDSEREYIALEYAAGDMLYVPTEQADRVSRYIGSTGDPPTLSRLGTQEWSRAKQRVRKSAKDLARELINLYAAREVLPGFAFSPDTIWQQELEASFPYTETPDQIEAVRQVKEDMERPKPMDRLICGDVGYGKTEIALRAAFKAVMDQKQVAILVPTTVLAQQHYATFSQRLAKFPIRVDLLSRFRSNKEQQHIIAGLKNGSVDIVIGTHRLLQKDVSFKDLGLVIIDEEQRFGVAHKERLKQLRREVDVLTLTATPIPRTLHMALVGVRDMSTLETPPEERLPIKTYVSEYNESLIREAIVRELERQGQVFFVHNRVKSIARIAHRLKEIVPEARIAYAHGQMSEEQLEETMLDFYQGRTNVLVCTSIIESGLDIPNANTIIVNEADKLGLAQLYQLRGRIGRSNTNAYAYLMYSKGKRLTPSAEKRLQAVFEASELGAGFRIAMKDLEIRGAGNLLGAEQSGHIAAVGFDLYCQMLSEAISELKALQEGKQVAPSTTPPPSVVIDLPLAAFIPESYVPDLSARLDIYHRLAKARTPEEIGQMGEELADRFGKLPRQVENLLYLVRIKLLASKLGIESVTREEDEVILRFGGEGDLRTIKLPLAEKWLKIMGTRQIRLDLRSLGYQWQKAVENVLSRLLDEFPLEQS